MKLGRYLARTFGAQGLAVVLLGLLSGASNVAAVVWLGRLLANHQTPPSSSLAWLAGCILVLLLSDLTAKAWLIRLTAVATANLRRDLTRQILQRPFEQLERIGDARLLSVLMDDVAKIGQTLGGLPSVSIGVVTASGCILYLAYLSPKLMAVSLAVGLPVAWSCLVIHRRARHHVRAAFQARDAVFEHFSSLTQGIKELKLNAARRRAFVEEVLEPELVALPGRTATARLWYQLSQTGSQVSVFVLLLGILTATMWLPVNAGILTTFAVVMLYSKTAIHTILNWLPTCAEAESAIANLEDLGFSLFASPPIQATDHAPTRPVQLDLTGVCFRYATAGAPSGDESFALGPLDLTFRSGEVIFMIGGNGSGKTTLMKLLIGLYAPSSGVIRLNGTAISEHNREQYLQHFSVVFADFYLFERLLGSAEDDLPAQAREYLRQLELAHRVTLSRDSLSTTRLSHGQRQRLALLTAYLEDRPVYVFDEWAANQDPKFRDVFYRRILPELKARGKLVVVISHDDRYFDLADRLIRLTDGLVAAPSQFKTAA